MGSAWIMVWVSLAASDNQDESMEPMNIQNGGDLMILGDVEWEMRGR
jgi:hypothetical protein